MKSPTPPLEDAAGGATLPESEEPRPARPRGRAALALRRLLARVFRLVVLGIGLAVFYAWGSKWFHATAEPAGFARGVLHGALMPMALPALLAGQDVPIYAEANTGRPYKLGYIVGINACGLVVFGTAFLAPRRRKTDSG